MKYIQSTANKQALTDRVFALFTDSVGGDPKRFADILYNCYEVESPCHSDMIDEKQIMDYLQRKVVPHKIAVLQAGVMLSETTIFEGYPAAKERFLENLWLHDLSKFSANEVDGYAFYNFRGDNTKEVEAVFESAWHHHKMNNPHHPEHWLSVDKRGNVTALPMPFIYVAEMVADWIGAGKTYGSTLEKWLPENIGNFSFHPDTAAVLVRILGEIGIDVKNDPIAGMSIREPKTDQAAVAWITQ